MDQVTSTTTNGTSSGMDILLAVPRLAQRAGSFAFFYLPEQFDTLLGKVRNSGSVIAEPTTSGVQNWTVTSTAASFVQASTPAPQTAGAMAAETASEVSSSMWSFQAIKNLGGVFSYMSSKWALATFATAIILNRAQFYASSRVPLTLKWHVRTALYLLPILVFLYQTQWLLQGIRCQTSPDWRMVQYGGHVNNTRTDFAGEGGLLYGLSSALLFWESDDESCSAVNMLPQGADMPRKSGSLALLWPFFVSLSFGQFIETLACALQGRQPMPETGMTIFEHSLAYAEAEAMMTRPFGILASLSRTVKVTAPSGEILELTGAAITQILNVPPEVLVISLISSLSHLCSNITAVLGIRARYRLVTTGVWGVAYMAAFLWSFLRAASLTGDTQSDMGVLRFPTVCIVGFIPHILIFVGILVCGAIYGLAILLTALSPPPGQEVPATLSGRLRAAYSNLQANAQLSTGTAIRINWQEDFYTALLKVGFTILTAASEAVYLNEGSRIHVHPMTWIEQKRIGEIASSRGLLKRSLDSIPSELRSDAIAQGLRSIDQPDGLASLARTSGYARERKTRTGVGASDLSRAAGNNNGVGLLQRRGRWATAVQMIKGIFWLCLALYAEALIVMLRMVHITYRPAWLTRLTDRQAAQKGDGRATNRVNPTTRDSTMLDFWLLDDNGELTLPTDVDIDIEEETRKRFQGISNDPETTEESVSTTLYNWWKNGGWWGEVDTSGEYEVSRLDDDDTTSVITTATDMEHDWSDIEGDESGRRTPTQRNPYPSISRESTPFAIENPLDTTRLAELLDPQTPEQREEARLLSRHLQTPGPLTRSQYRKAIERERARLITSSRHLSSGTGSSSRSLAAEDDEAILERFILERRQNARSRLSGANPSSANTWEAGAEGMGSEGPQCVVCQVTPRTILVWPCGCLSLCDECRVGLATKNYTSCVCCRTDVVAYSRLFVP